MIYKQIGEVFGKLYYHAYVKATGPKGNEFFIRGGPGGSPDSNPMSTALSDASSMGSSGDGEFGNIYISIGKEAENIEQMQADDLTVLAFVTTTSFDLIVEQLTDYGNRVNNSEIPYRPVSQNSNTFAHQAVEEISGVRTEAPVNSPGSDNELEVG